MSRRFWKKKLTKERRGDRREERREELERKRRVRERKGKGFPRTAEQDEQRK